MAAEAPQLSARSLIRSVALAREYGVEWVEALAHEIERSHRPDRARLTVRWQWRVLPVPRLRHARCTACRERWICPDAAWAEGLVSTGRHALGR
ncbi:hypothetical protein [Actinopolymorpha pittospori]